MQRRGFDGLELFGLGHNAPHEFPVGFLERNRAHASESIADTAERQELVVVTDDGSKRGVARQLLGIESDVPWHLATR